MIINFPSVSMCNDGAPLIFFAYSCICFWTEMNDDCGDYLWIGDYYNGVGDRNDRFCEEDDLQCEW